MKLFKNPTIRQLAFSFGGQIAFLLTNFILFIYLIKEFSQAEYGAWALYITIISIIDGIRQGFVQNGFISFYIKAKDPKRLVSSAFLLNFCIIILASVLAWCFSIIWFSVPQETSALLQNSWKTLVSIGLLQFINSYFHAQKDQWRYLLNNLLYLISFVLTMAIWSFVQNIGFEQVLDIQLLIIIPSFLYFLSHQKKVKIPGKKEIRELISFGRYAAGTNLSSLLFQKVDILMIAYFLDPIAVAIYHLTIKILAYAEIPMQAISQFIYPQIAHGLHQKGVTHLNIMYSRSVLMLLAFVIPLSLILILFREQLILLLSDQQYLPASELIMCFAFSLLFKPWGRVFGLSLDALSKPKVNFAMLIFSLIINVSLNAILIPTYGLIGGALATTVSIISTVIIGQILLFKTQGFNPVVETYHFTRNIKKYGILWN